MHSFMYTCLIALDGPRNLIRRHICNWIMLRENSLI